MTIRNRILTAFLILSLAGVAAGVAGHVHLSRSHALLTEAGDKLDRYSRAVERAYSLVFSINDKIFVDLVSLQPREDSQPLLDGESVEFYRLILDMDQIIPSRFDHHQEFREAFLSYYVFANRLLAQGRSNLLATDREVLDHFQERKARLSDQLVETLAELRTEYRLNSERAEALAALNSRLLFAVALIIVTAAASVAWMLSRSFAKPMSRLLAEVERFEAGSGDSRLDRPPCSSDEVESLVHAFAMMRERLSARERELLRHNLESVGRLAAGMAHEYNNLLGAVAACLHPLKAGCADPDLVREEAERIALLCRRGGELSSQLVALAGRSGPSGELLDAGLFCDHLKGLLPRLVPGRMTLTVELAQGLPPIRCSSALLLSAILNLVYNAVDATPEGGRIHVSIASETEGDGGEFVVFSVSDSGTGIPVKLAALVFDPFFTTKEPGEGSGLGLSIVHAFAEHHGGAVKFTRRMGRTVFSLRMPASKPLARGTRVLVLTDRPTAAHLASEILAGAGFSALCPSGGEQLLDVVRSFPREVDMVLIDTELASITPEVVYKLLKRFYPATPLSFFGSRAEVAKSIDPAAPWSESPDAGALHGERREH